MGRVWDKVVSDLDGVGLEGVALADHVVQHELEALHEALQLVHLLERDVQPVLEQRRELVRAPARAPDRRDAVVQPAHVEAGEGGDVMWGIRGKHGARHDSTRQHV